MRKVLITGFRHSGTTMLMQLVRAHPRVGWIEMEEGYIEYSQPREWLIKMAKKKVPDMKRYMWGEKLPWGTRKNDIKAERAIIFTDRWLKIFGKDARVLHIIRHPIDSAASGLSGGFGKESFRFSTSSLPRYISFINQDERCATIIYEELLTEPIKKLDAIFKFLELKSNKDIIKKVMSTELKFGKMDASRAYAHKVSSSIPPIEFDYEELLGKVVRKL